MAGRVGHIYDARRVGHIPKNGIRTTNYAYGFGGVYAHWDANYGTNTKTNGAVVSSWESLYNNYSLNATSNQPLFNSANALFNNLPAVNYNTSAKISILSRVLEAWGTIAFVFHNNSINNCNAFLAAGSGVNLRISLGGSNAGQVGIGIYRDAGNTPNITTTIENTNAHIVVMTTGLGIYVDGSLITSGALVSFSATQIGDTNFNANSLAQVAEIICFYTPLTNSDSLELMTKLNQKYAIY